MRWESSRQCPCSGDLFLAWQLRFLFVYLSALHHQISFIHGRHLALDYIHTFFSEKVCRCILVYVLYRSEKKPMDGEELDECIWSICSGPPNNNLAYPDCHHHHPIFHFLQKKSICSPFFIKWITVES
jgi:hypothetical protein